MRLSHTLLRLRAQFCLNVYPHQHKYRITYKSFLVCGEVETKCTTPPPTERGGFNSTCMGRVKPNGMEEITGHLCSILKDNIS